MDKNPIDKKEILRYLGYKNQEIDEITNNLIDEAIEEIKKIVEKRYVYKVFDISRKENKIFLENTKFELKGDNIKEHLKKSKKCILLGISLGHKIDTRIRYYEKISMDKALILDACATTVIEDISNEICKKIAKTLKKDEKSLTRRYSPGYGDLSLDIQGKFLSLIDARKTIGLTSTNSNILIPRKSITAIMGIIDIKDKEKKPTCRDCNKYSTCIFSKGDERCGS